MGEVPVSFDRAKALGANAGIAKPVSRGALMAAVKAQLRTKV
jgi:DNA-binding response OmpR family regulator